MFRKINNKILLSVFVVLLAIVVLVELMDSRKGNRTFKSDLVEATPEEVTSLEIYPKANNGELVKLYHEGDSWKVESGGKKYNADGSAAIRMISELDEMKPKSVAATSKESWEQFEVTDSLGTRVKLFNGDKVIADVVVGKFSFQQPRSTTSYVRVSNDKEVYAVDGMLGMSFNRNLNSFRDRTIIKSNKTDWTKLTFSYPSDSSFVLEKKADKWMIGDMQADSAKVAQYFSRIAGLNDGSFANEKPVIAPTHRLYIEGNNMMQPVEIIGYYTDTDNFVLESSQNPDTWFNNAASARKVFISVMELISAQ
ncbi:MAG: DUF4340 domain-containing protein [Draconibacterium sp.]